MANKESERVIEMGATEEEMDSLLGILETLIISGVIAAHVPRDEHGVESVSVDARTGSQRRRRRHHGRRDGRGGRSPIGTGERHTAGSKSEGRKRGKRNRMRRGNGNRMRSRNRMRNRNRMNRRGSGRRSSPSSKSMRGLSMTSISEAADRIKTIG